MLLLVSSITLALLVSAACNILEACLLSLSSTDIAGLAVKRPQLAHAWRGLKQNIQKPIAVILIVNTLAHTIGAAVSGAQWNALFGSKWIAVYSLAFSFVMIQWTELLPKGLAVAYNQALAPLVAVTLQIAVRLFSPLLVVMEWLNRPFDRFRKSKTASDALGEIALLARFASYEKLITREQEDIVARSIRLTNTRVQDIMVSRADIKSVSSNMSMAEALIETHIHHHTRYLLTEGSDLDKVLGYVNVKDIVSALQLNPHNPSLRGIARPVPTVSATLPVPALLKELTKHYQHIALVQDVQGHSIGLVTMEDVIETIIGEIEDEYDVLPTYLYSLAEERFLAGGGIALQELKEKTGLQSLPTQSLSLHDWLVGLAPENAAIGKSISYHDLIFTVRKMRRSRIYETIVEKQPAQAAAKRPTA